MTFDYWPNLPFIGKLLRKGLMVQCRCWIGVIFLNVQFKSTLVLGTLVFSILDNLDS